MRRVEVRKVDGEPLPTSPVNAEITAAAKAAGYTDGYRGLQYTARPLVPDRGSSGGSRR